MLPLQCDRSLLRRKQPLRTCIRNAGTRNNGTIRYSKRVCVSVSSFRNRTAPSSFVTNARGRNTTLVNTVICHKRVIATSNHRQRLKFTRFSFARIPDGSDVTLRYTHTSSSISLPTIVPFATLQLRLLSVNYDVHRRIGCPVTIRTVIPLI